MTECLLLRVEVCSTSVNKKFRSSSTILQACDSFLHSHSIETIPNRPLTCVFESRTKGMRKVLGRLVTDDECVENSLNSPNFLHWSIQKTRTKAIVWLEKYTKRPSDAVEVGGSGENHHGRRKRGRDTQINIKAISFRRWTYSNKGFIPLISWRLEMSEMVHDKRFRTSKQKKKGLYALMTASKL